MDEEVLTKIKAIQACWGQEGDWEFWEQPGQYSKFQAIVDKENVSKKI